MFSLRWILERCKIGVSLYFFLIHCVVLSGHCHCTKNVSSVSEVEARLQSAYNPEYQNPYFHPCENLKTSLFMKSTLIFNVQCCKTIYCWKSKEKYNSLMEKILTLYIMYLLKYVSVGVTVLLGSI